MLRRQRIHGRYVVEEIQSHDITVVLGVQLDGVQYDRVGERIRIEGRGKYQLECPASPNDDLVFIPHPNNTTQEPIQMSPERANVLAADGKLSRVD